MTGTYSNVVYISLPGVAGMQAQGRSMADRAMAAVHWVEWLQRGRPDSGRPNIAGTIPRTRQRLEERELDLMRMAAAALQWTEQSQDTS